MPDSIWPADIVEVDEEDNEPADNEEKIDSGMTKLKHAFKCWNAVILIEVPCCMIKHHSSRCDASICLDPAKFRGGTIVTL